MNTVPPGEAFGGQIVFAAPHLLWLLVAPAMLLAAWMVRFGLHRLDLRRLRRQRSLPIRERFAIGGDWWPWFFLTLAIASLVVAAARPRGMTTTVNRAGVDIVVLQDGSASMHVTDLPPNRWSRSMAFLRLLGDALSWNDDRMALTVFAHIAAPQIRLTNDPNTLFFFLDHLHGRPPFRLQDDTTWDTNLEQGIAWGLRLLEKDRELRGPSSNGRLFVMLSDGESWSGEVARSIEKAAREHVPLFVIGVGTLAGGPLPEIPAADGGTEPSPGRSRLDRASLQRIAAAGGGQYFELDREPDRDIANAIIDAGRRLAPATVEESAVNELYWRFLAAAVGCVAIGAMLFRERAELWMQLTASALSGAALWRLFA